jgi:hypothetical protein
LQISRLLCFRRARNTIARELGYSKSGKKERCLKAAKSFVETLVETAT